MGKSINDRDLAIARVYAESLLSLADEQGEGDAVLEELEGLVQLQDRDQELEQFFSSPLVDDSTRREVLDKTLRGQLSDVVMNTLQTMNNKGRLGLTGALAVAYREALDAKRGRVDVAVASAIALPDALRDKLRQTLARVTGQEVRLVETVDPEILGGVIISLGDRKIDYSLATDLRQLDDVLRERATHEILSATE